MKRLFLIIVLATYSLLHAQKTSSVSGKVLDKTTNLPLSYVSIKVLTQNNQLVTGSISNNKGFFSIDALKEGKYIINISSLGFETEKRSLLVGQLNQFYHLGKIYLKEAKTVLNTVIIKGEKSEISNKLDKKTYQTKNLIAQSGGTVMDAMKSMPGVGFDQEGKVMLRGSDKVIVLIDGKQSSLTGYGNQKGLDNIPASNIESIEIINNPSAKYDANGMAGIINIIYKKEQKTGIHGSVGFAYGLGVFEKRKADLPTELGSFDYTPKYIPSFDLNYHEEKLSAFLQAEVLSQKRLPNNEFTTRFYDDGRIIASQVPENRKQTHYIFKSGIDFNIDDHNSLSLSGIYDFENHVDTAQVAYFNRVSNQINRLITWNEEEETGYINLAAHYEHQFEEPGHKLESHLQYTKGWEDETYFVNEDSSLRPNARDITNVLATEHTTNFAVDYTKPLQNGRIETGAKLQIRSLPVEYTQTRDVNSILYDGLGDWSKWGESIYALYANWVLEKTKIDIEAGLRSEYTSVFYNVDEANIYYQRNDKYDYFRFFPSTRFTYKINKQHKLSAFYNFRVDRPGEPQLRIYPKSDDHELVKVGNPYLRPQFTQSVELGYKTQWKGGSLFVASYFKDIKDPYMRVYTEDTSNSLNTMNYDIVLKSYANTGKAQNWGLEFIFSQKLFDIWKLSGNMNFYQNKIFAHQGELLFPNVHIFTIDDSTDNTWSFKFINTLNLPKDFQVQLTGLYLAPKNIPQGEELSRSSIDIGLKKELLNRKGEITLSVSDILNQYGIRQRIQSAGFNATYENFYETQMVRLGLKYKF